MKSIVLTGLLFAAVVAPAVEYGALFLTVYPGARQCGMAGAGAALPGTAGGVLYNPAGPSFLKSPEADIEVGRVPWALPTDYWSAAAVVPLLNNLNIGAFTSGTRQPFDGAVSWHEWQAGVTASARVSDWLGFGLNLEHVGLRYAVLRTNWYGEPEDTIVLAGSAFAADAGVLARPRTCCGRPSLGIAVRNVGTRLKYSNTTSTSPLPALLVAGVGWTVAAREFGLESFPVELPERFFPSDWLMDNWGASVFYDLRKVFLDDYPAHSVGIEVRPLPFLAARGGWFYSNSSNAPDKREGLTWGFGLDLRYVRVDLCEDRNLFYVRTRKNYRFSIALNLGAPLLRESGLLGH